MNPCAIITGAGSGIGAATAEKFLAQGYQVILLGRRPEPLKAIEKNFPTQALAIPCDISSEIDLKNLFSSLKNLKDQSFSQIEFLINNAGIYEQKSFLDSHHEDFLKIFEVNFFASVNLTRLILPFLIQNKKGAVINISSTLGERPVAKTSAYSASKAAMINLTKSLALEMAPYQIRVNCICPGLVDTPIHSFYEQKDELQKETKAQMQSFQPLGRIGRPEEIAHHIFQLCAPGSEWTTGSVLDVDGGIHL